MSLIGDATVQMPGLVIVEHGVEQQPQKQALAGDIDRQNKGRRRVAEARRVPFDHLKQAAQRVEIELEVVHLVVVAGADEGREGAGQSAYGIR